MAMQMAIALKNNSKLSKISKYKKIHFFLIVKLLKILNYRTESFINLPRAQCPAPLVQVDKRV